ncbi:MAG: SIS domain-containing protein [Bryobacteraceae bacterium]
MTETQTLQEKNLKAEIFSAPVVADEIARMWTEKRAAIRQIAKEIAARKPRSLVFTASGGSAAALYSGYWAALRYLKLPVHYLIGPDIMSSQPAALDSDCVAITASYSGRTVDTVRTRDRLLKQGVPLFAITRYADAELAQGATWKVTYESIALYSSPAYLTMCLVVDLARERGEFTPEVAEFEKQLEALPQLLRDIAEPSRQMAERLAPELDSGKLLVLAAGGAYTLGHMMTYDMFGEFLKEYAAFIHTGEFRHGPLEIVRPGEPVMLFLTGNDDSRPFSEAAILFGQGNGAKTVVFDGRELAPNAHPLFDALVLYQSQLWLLYYMACRRNVDLTDYKYMHVVPFAAGDTFF